MQEKEIPSCTWTFFFLLEIHLTLSLQVFHANQCFFFLLLFFLSFSFLEYVPSGLVAREHTYQIKTHDRRDER